MRDALTANYEYVFWIDADAFIFDTGVDLRQAFVDHPGSILACQHPNPPHLNVGVMFLRNTERVKEFVQVWLDQMIAITDGWGEQGVFNKMKDEAQWGGLVAQMHDKWNSTYYAKTVVPDAVIKGYHGADYITPVMRFQAMQSDIARAK